MKLLLSCCCCELACPGMDDGFPVEVVEMGKYALFEFCLGCDADMSGHGLRGHHKVNVLQRKTMCGLVNELYFSESAFTL